MSYFYLKNKKTLVLFTIIFIYLFFYDFFLIGHINDLSLVNNINDLNKLYTVHPYLPLSRIIKEMYNVQYFDSVGIKEILLAFTYIISALSIFDFIFILCILFLIYQFCFHQDYVNSLGLTLLGGHFVVFIVHIVYCSIKLFNCLVYVNSSIVVTMHQLKSATITALIFYILLLLGAIYMLITPLIKRRKLLNY